MKWKLLEYIGVILGLYWGYITNIMVPLFISQNRGPLFLHQSSILLIHTRTPAEKATHTPETSSDLP